MSNAKHTKKSRKIGVEIEYVGLDIEASAKIIQKLFGGEVERVHKNLFKIKTTQYGDFNVELDAKLLKFLAEKSQQSAGQSIIDVFGATEEIISIFIKDLVPIEIVSPPIKIQDITIMDKVIKELKSHGAEGTKQSILNAFGVHLNPEVKTMTSSKLLAILQAYVLLNDWLREEIQVDNTRWLSQYIAEYPLTYQKLILQKDYSADFSKLIDDYIKYNPTRNRSLDMLPLFRVIDEDKVKSLSNHNLIKARPTYHYRLPNCQLDDPTWSVSIEWERWRKVEKLAEQDELRREMAREFLQIKTLFNLNASTEWLEYSSKCVNQL